jgi:Tfp pilus assembly protein PilE
MIEKHNRGITLLSLIITIVIMLILATVTVNVVIDGGLF